MPGLLVVELLGMVIYRDFEGDCVGLVLKKPCSRSIVCKVTDQ